VNDRLILVTGASGFVGRALCDHLEREGRRVRKVLRRSQSLRPGLDVGIEGIGASTDWNGAFEDVETVIHLAARAHVMRESVSDPLAVYRETNVAGTRRLAEAAAAAGVKRFIFISSIKVNGERTLTQPFRESDEARPEDAYGVTKFEAERELSRIAAGTKMAMTIIRPPLVYGPGVKGNLLALMRVVNKGVPLPLASIRNSRSLVFVDNLVSAIMTCLGAARAAGQTFLVSDGEDLSTRELIERLAMLLGSRPRLFRCPPKLLRFAGVAIGRKEQIARLTESLRVDSSKIRRELGWSPPFSVDQGLVETAKWFLSSRAVD